MLNSCNLSSNMAVDFIDEMKKDAFKRLNSKSMTELPKEKVIKELEKKYPMVSSGKIIQIVSAIDRERFIKQTMGGVSPTPALQKEKEADKVAEKIAKVVEDKSKEKLEKIKDKKD